MQLDSRVAGLILCTYYCEG